MFELYKKVVNIVVWGLLAAYVGGSVVISQLTSPYYFKSVNRDPLSLLPILKAVVEYGDLMLLKTAFPVSVGAMYEKVFEQYVYKADLEATIKELENRVPESRDLEMAKGYLLARDGQAEDAKKHFLKAKEIDPLIFIPIDLVD